MPNTLSGFAELSVVQELVIDLETDRVSPTPYDNPEGLIESVAIYVPLDRHGDRVAAAAATAVIANSDLATGRRQSAVNAIAKCDSGLAIRGLTNGEIEVQRTGVGEGGDELPRLAVHGDGYVGFPPGGTRDKLRHQGIVSHD